jgi:hypothetical protein
VRDYERKYWLLWKENTDLRELTLEMREELAGGELNTIQDEDKLGGGIRTWLSQIRRGIAPDNE